MATQFTPTPALISDRLATRLRNGHRAAYQAGVDASANSTLDLTEVEQWLTSAADDANLDSAAFWLGHIEGPDGIAA